MRTAPLESMVIAFAAVAVVAQLLFLAATAGIGLLHRVPSIASDDACSAPMDMVLTPDGHRAYLSPETTRPKGWVTIAEGAKCP
ncbi:hypothetical protein E8D34_07395 [Nocardioides sp. GY 10113]|uniref:hypothetical protein n=1 Tax=Nocardioides sp. GY 10113 TaxID=2569761 RepID=UPI0010A8598E|nr:hypothetical protein [Nocardioides sp. GY 10113]TIC88102.1 hypothetical protein E8D34_07395 [Nocardioides sp. GY 10113]